MKFIDEVTIELYAGNGGNGLVAWNRNRMISKGGPAGGNGGNGGNVYMRTVNNIEKLFKYRKKDTFHAENGGNGGKQSLTGKNGDDLIIDIPIGSFVTNLRTGKSYDFAKDGMMIKVLSGGDCGYGNEYFKSSRNVTPWEQTDGMSGEHAYFKIELRLIASVGLVGLPNAGKTTLLNTITNAHAKIGDYPFTTLEPNLGVFQKWVIADIPGLIEGAADGRGIGDTFLRHIMRTDILLHCISVEDPEKVVESYDTIRRELVAYDGALEEKSETIVLTKIDLVSEGVLEDIVQTLSKHTNNQIIQFTYDSDDVINNFRVSLEEVLVTVYNKK